LAINTSHRVLDLRRAVERNAHQHGLFQAHIIDHPERHENGHFGREWILLSRSRDGLNSSVITKWTGIVAPPDLSGTVLTDEFASLRPLLR